MTPVAPAISTFMVLSLCWWVVLVHRGRGGHVETAARRVRRWRLLLRMPAGGVGEAPVGHALAVAADVVGAAGRGSARRAGRDRRRPCATSRRTPRWVRRYRYLDRRGDPASARRRDRRCVRTARVSLLGDDRRVQGALAGYRGVLVHRTSRRVDERHGRLDVHRGPDPERGIHQDPRRLDPQPVVLVPRIGMGDLVERQDARGQVDDGVDAAASPSSQRPGSNRSSWSLVGATARWPAAAAIGRNARPRTPCPAGDEQAHRLHWGAVQSDGPSSLGRHPWALPLVDVMVRS